MKKIVTLSILLLCLVFNAAAQTVITGVLRDTVQRQGLANTAVILINAKDSTLVQTVRTNANGNFRITEVGTGDYILLAAYATYADYTEMVKVTDQPQINLGSISMVTKAHLLKEVVIKRELGAIIIKGDTTEFVADSFHLQANASVEDLLKRLPGIQVDKNGKITAQGETVRKVLIDGEEFFGDDPTLVTHNLRASMIDKVQLYDKKSDLAVATGVNDGVKDKTINLQLKENSKKGYFGKIIAGGGLKGYYENQAMLNYFRGKQKISLYGTLSNTGRIGLGWRDDEKYSVKRDESITKDSELDSWSGNYEGQGIPLAQTGGIHYSDKWNEDRQAINLNYKVAGLNVEGNSNVRTQNNLPGQIIYSNTDQTFKNNIFKNKLTGDYDLKADSATTIKLGVTGILNHKTTDNYFVTDTRDQDSALLNSGTRHLSNTGDLRNLNTNLFVERKLGKPGRTLALNLHENYIDDNTEGFIRAENTFYKQSGDSTSLLDLRRTDVTRSLYLDGKLVYTEPLSKKLLLSASYGLFVNTSKSKVNTYNKSSEGHYDLPDPAFSNNYQFDQRIHQGGLAFSYNTNKIHLNAGTDVGFTNFTQENLNDGSKDKRSFVNWYPAAELAYVFKLQRSISIYYNGNTKMPAINQVQPVFNINDPLNVYLGNPLLSPSFTNVLGIKYNSYEAVSQRYLFSNFNYSFSNNQIVTNTITDNVGRNTYQYVNAGGNSRYWGYLGIGKKLEKLDAHTGANLSVNGERMVNFTNNARNILNNRSYGLEVYANQYKADKYDIGLNVNGSYNTNKASLQALDPVNYWLFSLVPTIDVFLPGKLQLHTDVNYQLRQKTAVFNDNLDVFLWNAWIGKKLAKNDALLIKLSANDLLNQNRGFNRFVSGNFISQNNYTTVQRFFLLSVTWNFIQSSMTETKE